jgi:hypothetical protein
MAHWIVLFHLFSPGLHATQTTGCGSQVQAQAFRFSSAYDAYSGAPLPEWKTLRRWNWKLTGLATGRFPLLREGDGYQKEGYSVAGRVPTLSFRTRIETRLDSQFEGTTSWLQSDRYAIRQGWAETPGFSATFVPDLWGTYAELKRQSLTYSTPTYGEGAFVFQYEDSPNVSPYTLQHYCRMVGANLICMVEAITPTGESRGIVAFLLWEPLP